MIAAYFPQGQVRQGPQGTCALAIIHEDGFLRRRTFAKGDEAGSKKHGFNIVLKEGYSVSATRSSRRLVTKLKRGQAGRHLSIPANNPDHQRLFMRQAA